MLRKFLTSPALSILLMVIWAVALGFATVVEKYAGTAMAMRLVYINPAFFLFPLAIVAGFIGYLFNGGIRRMSLGGLIIHLAFIIILAGATFTHCFSKEGNLSLTEGQRSNKLEIPISPSAVITEDLPFELELVKFHLIKYPGSDYPSSYESEVLVHADGQTFPARIYMNHVLDLKGWRIYQSATIANGSVLLATRDAIGRTITYAGYVSLLVGFILFVIGPRSRFSVLRKKLKELRAAKVIALILLAGASATMQANPVQPIPDNQIPADIASRFGALPMQADIGRIMPINSLATEFVRKLYGSRSIGSFSPNQFILSAMTQPEKWQHVPLIKVSSAAIRAKYGLQKGRSTFAHFFDRNGSYLLEEEVRNAALNYPRQTSYDKAIVNLDRKIRLLHGLFEQQSIRIFPIAGDSTHRWAAPSETNLLSLPDYEIAVRLFQTIQNSLSIENAGDKTAAIAAIDSIRAFQQSRTTIPIDSKRIDTELRYNRLDPFRLCQILYLALGGSMLVVAFAGLTRSRRWLNILGRSLGVAVLVAFHFQMIGMTMRWHIGGYAPWSNAYETMVYVAWASVCGGLLLARRNLAVLALATLFAGIILFVARISGMNPAIGLLVPVLKSPWLMFHVAVIVAAYGFFGVSCMLGIYNLALIKFGPRMGIPSCRATELTVINEMSMWIGLALMTIGTFLGAIWANESWGRYWGWDPKETWALISIITYAAVLHLRLIRSGDNVRLFNLAGALAFLVVLMTYFGVNYLLSGMHSYG